MAGINSHRNFVRILAGDALVHLEQIAVAIRDDVLAKTLDGIGEIEIHAEAGVADSAAFIANCFRIARRDIARNQIAEAGIAALQIIVALRLPGSGWAGVCRLSS